MKNKLDILNTHIDKLNLIDSKIKSFNYLGFEKITNIDKISCSNNATTISSTTSNEIEGIFERENDSNDKKKMVRRINENYNNILKQIKSNYENIEISTETILNWHTLLFSGVDVGSKNVGVFKTKQNYVSSFKPSSPIETPEKIVQLFNWFNNDDNQINQIIKSLVLIADFLMIHPFEDGNGRISRLLTNLLLIKFSVRVVEYIPLERYILENKRKYYDSLEQINFGWHENLHNYNMFIDFNLNMILSLFDEWNELIGFNYLITTNKLSRKNIIILIINKLIEKSIVINKKNILDYASRYQLQISSDNVKDILKELVKDVTLISRKIGRNSYYEYNEKKIKDKLDKIIKS